MKNIIKLIFLSLVSFLLISCGGESSNKDDNSKQYILDHYLGVKINGSPECYACTSENLLYI